MRQSQFWVAQMALRRRRRPRVRASGRSISAHGRQNPHCLPGCLPRRRFSAAEIAEVLAAQAQLQKASDLPPKADIADRNRHVRFVQETDYAVRQLGYGHSLWIKNKNAPRIVERPRLEARKKRLTK
jgi:hypothetical protein